MNYDVVIGIGCSFMNGDRIVDEDGVNVGKDLVAPKLLAEKLSCDYVHLGRTGSSNERMFKNIYEWIENNNKTGHYEKPLFIIGLSGTARWMFRSQHLKKYFDLQPAHVQNYDDEALEKVNVKVTDHMVSVDKLREWLEYYVTWIYDIDEYELKLQRSVMMLHHYLKGNKCDYRIHNSLEDSLGDVKDKINFLSFKDDNYKDEDTWKHYLMWQMKHIDNEDYESELESGDPRKQKYRNPFPPYGKRFCEGHPSPNANKELFERIYEDLK